MRLQDVTIGYSGYSINGSAPGDRRRFLAWAKLREVSWKPASLEGMYDVVYLTHHSDLPGWLHRKEQEGDRLRIIFELVDSYLTQDHPVRRRIKGVARRALGVDSRLSADFHSTLKRICAASDAVLCSTEEQVATIRAFNQNVLTSFDWFGDELPAPKQNYTRGSRLRIGWEGQAITLSNINEIAPTLNLMADRIELHVVADPVLRRIMGRFGARRSSEVLSAITAPVIFHEWCKDSFTAHLKACDLVIIPIDATCPMMRGKPENKLILLWKLGLPVVTSASCAYSRAMAGAGLDLTCVTLDDWREALERLAAASCAERAALAEKGRTYAEKAYSIKHFCAPFDRAFSTAGITIVE